MLRAFSIMGAVSLILMGVLELVDIFEDDRRDAADPGTVGEVKP